MIPSEKVARSSRARLREEADETLERLRLSRNWDKTAIRRRYRRCPIMPGENGSRSVLVIAFIVIGPILMPINVVK